jgi:dolichol-phosphate mannosyltransferase
MSCYKETTLIIPTLNEVENIPILLDLLEKLYPEIEIIISDGGSTDGTQELVKKRANKNKNIKLIGNEKFLGLCENVIEAAKLVKRKYIVVMDADLQHPPEKVKDIAEKLNNGYDIVIARRTKIKDWGNFRKFISWGATLLGKICLFVRRKKMPKDLLSGFFGIKTSLFQKMIKKYPQKFELRGYKILFDLIKVSPRETKIGEINYTFRGRQKGKSKIRIKHAFCFIKSLLK